MNFSDKLNEYLKKLNITSKKLSELTSISQSVISRYRNGERTPLKDSKQLEIIVNKLNEINMDQKMIIKEDIKVELEKTIKKDTFDYDCLSNNLNNLIKSLSININKMSKYINFDPSHISRIRYQKSKPSDPIDFLTKIANYVVEKHNTDDDREIIKGILNCNDDCFNDEVKIKELLLKYLTENTGSHDDQTKKFLINFDNFDLNDYIKAIKFDKIKIPNIPFYKGKTRNYYGIEEMKKGEIDFFKTTVLSKQNKDIFMYSNMPMEDMAKDIDFGKKWMFSIACCLKRGLHINIIHNLDRPYNEMMLGLQSWVPIYMTGQVSPFYFKNNKNNVYNQLDYVSGSGALTGEAIKGYHSEGKYYLTTNSKEINYYREKADLLLKKANPLMEIYKDDNKNEFEKFLSNSKKIKTKRTRIFSSLPLFTIEDDLLRQILIKNNLSNEEIEMILKYKIEEENSLNEILKENIINDTVYKLEDEGEKISLSLENIFYSNITYTYEDYLKHYEQTIAYQKKCKNYRVTETDYKTFNNITITILDNHYVILTKAKNPTIHFVIRHPKLVDSIKNFNPIIKE